MTDDQLKELIGNLEHREGFANFVVTSSELRQMASELLICRKITKTQRNRS